MRRFFLQGVLLVLFVSACTPPPPGEVRLRELWLSLPGAKTTDPQAFRIHDVTRSGIPVKIGERQLLPIAVPRDAALHVAIGVSAPGAATLSRGIVASITACSDSKPDSAVLASVHFSPPFANTDWVDLRIDLSAYAGSHVNLCLTASADEGQRPLPESHVVWFGDPVVRSDGFHDAASAKSNLIIITLDTTRADHLSSAGYPLPTTPNLDRMAVEPEGEQFLHAIAAAPWTLPSHGTLFTGLYPREHGARGDDEGDIVRLWRLRGLSPETVTLAERLASSGYHGVGVVGGPMVGAEFGFAKGFDYYDQTGTGEVAHPTNRRGAEITDLALQQLDQGSSPFHLFLNYFDPHWPYEPPADLLETWVPSDVKVIPNEVQSQIWHDVLSGKRDITPVERRSMVSHYDGAIASMDREIGRLLTGLKERGLYDNTMIVVVSDHGESFGEHRMVDHGHSLYEEVLRAALIIKYPKASTPPHAKVNTQTVDFLDVHATICRAMELPVPPGLEFHGVHQNAHDHFAELERNSFYVQQYGSRFDRKLEAVYRGRWKMIRDDKGHDWLFDLVEDPGEQKDLALVRVDQVTTLGKVMDEWAARKVESRPVTPAPDLAPQLKQRLKSLGYVGE